ncbi:hypothetical protein [Gymnodinialimonas sp. 57CJ19]|uniref:hypothetical protein n=1 Tax=Gymnodinialimonas sp. 57CJ19 TaxID=3138498 RepID=UPI0031345929
MALRIAAVTHVRKDDFFLDIWVKHYGQILGREHLYVMLDGDDWKTEVDLSGVNVSYMKGRSGHRIADNERFIKAHWDLMTELDDQYDLFVRGDCDELVCVDPQSGRSFQEAVQDAMDIGYRYTKGIEVVEVPGEAPLDPTKPLMGQRSVGAISKLYVKPNIVTGPTELTIGGHVAVGKPVVMSDDLLMMHMANASLLHLEMKVGVRTAEQVGVTFTNHTSGRLSLTRNVAACEDVVPYDEIAQKIYNEIGKRGKGSATRPRDLKTHNAIYGHDVEKPWVNKIMVVTLPERFADML